MSSIFDNGGFVGYSPNIASSGPMQGVTPTKVFYEGSNTILNSEFLRTSDCVFSCDLTFPGTFSDGQLMEVGGTARGCGVSLVNSGATLRSTCGDSTGPPPDAATSAVVDIATSNLVAGATGTLTWDYRINPGRARIWWNDTFLGEASTSGGGALDANEWAGTAAASYVTGSTSAPRNLSTGAWPGVVNSPLRYYEAQLVTTTERQSSGIWSLNTVASSKRLDIVTDGLTSHFDFTNKECYPGTGTTAYDLEDTGKTLTFSASPNYTSGGVAWTTPTGNSATFSSPSAPIASTTQISIGILYYGVTDSIASWVFSATASGNYVVNCHLTWSANANIYWDTGPGDGTYDRINALGTGSHEGWHYWVFTKNSSTGNAYIYLDGNATPWHSGTSLTKTLGTPDVFNVISAAEGNLAAMHIYSRELTTNEIAQNYNVYKNKYGL